MKRHAVTALQFEEPLLQALETARSGIEVYTAAIDVAVDGDLRAEWQKRLAESRAHEKILLMAFEALDLDPETASPGRDLAAQHGTSLLEAIQLAVANGDSDATQLVATECVVLAETKDRQNRELIETVIEQAPAHIAKRLAPGHDPVEKQEHHCCYQEETDAGTTDDVLAAAGCPAAA